MNNRRQYPALACLAQACDNLNLAYHYLDKNNNFIEISTKNGPLFFTNSITPFNNESVSKICNDKEFTYLLLKEILPLPKTLGYFDPHPTKEYIQYRDYLNKTEIIDHITRNFSLPVIVKRNTGSHGQNVFLCHTATDINQALGKIYLKRSTTYDYIALAQTYIKPKTEYRVIVFKGQVVLVYKKDNQQAKFIGNLSPLHYEGATAKIIEDHSLLATLQNFCTPIFSKLPIIFAGLDIIEDEAGQLWLIEINSKPGFDYFLKNNNSDYLIKMYQTILTKYLA